MPWAAKRLGHEVKWVEDRREHFVSSAHERGQLQEITVGFDDDGPAARAGRAVLARQRRLHAVRRHRARSSPPPSCSARTSRAPTACEWWSLYTNTVIVTPYRGRRPAAGRVRDGAHHRRDRRRARAGPGRGAAAQLHHPRRDALRPPADLPGRPAADLRLRRLPGVAAEADRSWSAGTTRWPRRRRPGPPGARSASAWPATSRAPASARTRARTSWSRPSGKVKVATGLTTQGQGHFTSFAQIAADELGVPFEDVEVVTGDTRRFGYAVGTFASRAAVMSGNAIALASRKVRAKALRIAGDALEADPGDLEIVDGVVRVKGSPGASIPLATVAVLSNPLRYAFDEASKAATQFAVGDAPRPAGRRRRGARPRGHRLLLADAGDLRQRHARRGRRDRPGDRRDPRAALLRRARLRPADQPDDRRGAGARRRRAGRRRRAVRADGRTTRTASCSTPRSWTS